MMFTMVFVSISNVAAFTASPTLTMSPILYDGDWPVWLPRPAFAGITSLQSEHGFSWMSHNATNISSYISQVRAAGFFETELTQEALAPVQAAMQMYTMLGITQEIYSFQNDKNQLLTISYVSFGGINVIALHLMPWFNFGEEIVNPNDTYSTHTYTWGGTVGLWEVSGGWGTMMLVQNGNIVTGTYGSIENQHGQILGTVSGNTLTGTWIQPDRSGFFEFAMSSDGMYFDVTWRDEGSESVNRGDVGTRVTPLTSVSDNHSWAGDAGIWTVTGSQWGSRMILIQNGNVVTGSYNWHNGIIEGTVFKR